MIKEIFDISVIVIYMNHKLYESYVLIICIAIVKSELKYRRFFFVIIDFDVTVIRAFVTLIEN